MSPLETGVPPPKQGRCAFGQTRRMSDESTAPLVTMDDQTMAEQASSATTARPRGPRRAAFRVGSIAVRWPRRGHQHDPPPAAIERRRGRPPRPQPQRVRHRARRHPGGCRRHRSQPPTRAATTSTSSTWSTCSRSRLRAHPRGRRRRRHDLAGRDRDAGAIRRREDLYARGRPAHGPAADDRGRAEARARGTQAALRIRPLHVRDHRRSRRRSPCSKARTARAKRPRSPIRFAARSRVKHQAPVVGITGTGGAGKSSLSDELLSRFVRQFPTGRSPSSRSIRPAAAPAARCSATASA